MIIGVKAVAPTQGFDLEGRGFRPQGPRQTSWAGPTLAEGLPPPHVRALPAGPAAWGWPHRHRSRWGHPACARRRTRGVPGVGLGVWDGSGSAPQDGRTGPGPRPHLPSSPRRSLAASPSKSPQSPHTWPRCLFSSRTCRRVGRAQSTLTVLAVTALPAPPCSSRGPPFLLGQRLSHQ